MSNRKKIFVPILSFPKSVNPQLLSVPIPPFIAAIRESYPKCQDESENFPSCKEKKE